ncbi:hypothetical protein [Streptomyces sp. NPDC047070]
MNVMYLILANALVAVVVAHRANNPDMRTAAALIAVGSFVLAMFGWGQW